jgi:hypothetical protein
MMQDKKFLDKVHHKLDNNEESAINTAKTQPVFVLAVGGMISHWFQFIRRNVERT